MDREPTQDELDFEEEVASLDDAFYDDDDDGDFGGMKDCFND